MMNDTLEALAHFENNQKDCGDMIGAEVLHTAANEISTLRTESRATFEAGFWVGYEEPNAALTNDYIDKAYANFVSGRQK